MAVERIGSLQGSGGGDAERGLVCTKAGRGSHRGIPGLWGALVLVALAVWSMQTGSVQGADSDTTTTTTTSTTHHTTHSTVADYAAHTETSVTTTTTI